MNFESLNNFWDLNQFIIRKTLRTVPGRPLAQGHTLHGLAANFAQQATSPKWATSAGPDQRQIRLSRPGRVAQCGPTPYVVTTCGVLTD
jgi:hypothetical protein